MSAAFQTQRPRYDLVEILLIRVDGTPPFKILIEGGQNSGVLADFERLKKTNSRERRPTQTADNPCTAWDKKKDAESKERRKLRILRVFFNVPKGA